MGLSIEEKATTSAGGCLPSRLGRESLTSFSAHCFVGPLSSALYIKRNYIRSAREYFNNKAFASSKYITIKTIARTSLSSIIHSPSCLSYLWVKIMLVSRCAEICITGKFRLDKRCGCLATITSLSPICNATPLWSYAVMCPFSINVCIQFAPTSALHVLEIAHLRTWDDPVSRARALDSKCGKNLNDKNRKY